jgi:Ca2+-binding RTX toxin-like protein
MPIINGTGGNDNILGTNQADTIYARGGNDIAHGNGGSDTVLGQAGMDQVFGDTGTDTVLGGSGNDIQEGNLGNDMLNGGGDNDALFGGSNSGTNSFTNDNDTLNGGAGYDSLTGGFGNDTFQYASIQGDDTVMDFNPHASTLPLDLFDDTVDLTEATSSEIQLVYGNTIEAGDFGVSNVGGDLVIDFIAAPVNIFGGTGDLTFQGLGNATLGVGTDLV